MRRCVLVQFRHTPLALGELASQKQFSNVEMTSHSRSAYAYEVSAKGEDVGARNEAAFIGYKPVVPANPVVRVGMPHIFNLLTVMPLYLAAIFAACIGWGIFLWATYCNTHFTVVNIERPARLQ